MSGTWLNRVKGRDAQMAFEEEEGGEVKVFLNDDGSSVTASDVVDDMFEYHRWNDDQIAQGAKVRAALAEAVKVILDCVPPGPDRTVAIRKIREARMDANSAITHHGLY